MNALRAEDRSVGVHGAMLGHRIHECMTSAALLGWAVGLGYLVLVTHVAGENTERAGLIAAAVAIVGVAISAGASDAVLLFGGVILTALAGSALAAFRARGMVWAMGAAALVQAKGGSMLDRSMLMSRVSFTVP